MISIKLRKLTAEQIFSKFDQSMKELLKSFVLDYEVDLARLEGKLSLGNECYGCLRAKDGVLEIHFDQLNTPLTMKAKTKSLFVTHLEKLDS